MPNTINCHGLMRKVKKTHTKQQEADNPEMVFRQSKDQMTSWHAVLLETVDKIVCMLIRQDLPLANLLKMCTSGQ